MNLASASQTSFETLAVTRPSEFVFQVELNRPEKLNAFNKALFLELAQCFDGLSDNEDCRTIILSGSGRLFTAGLDLQDAAKMAPEFMQFDDVSRRAKVISRYIKQYQDSISSLERCKKPVIVAVHSACIGAGINLVTAADMRYCTKDAWFQIKEVDLGMAADVGVLQRLPRVIGSESLVRDLAYTARKLGAEEALSCGLVSKVFDDKPSMMKHVTDIALEISKKSPVAVQGTKVNLVYSRDHSVEEGLYHMMLWNQMHLQSEDFMQGTTSQLTKEPAVFSKL